jgi:MFS family permease
MSIIGLAWTPKLLYGIFTDSFPILGSHKKSYLILCGLLQALSSIGLVLLPDITPLYIVGFCFISSLCSAVMDVVVDGLMVIMSKRDPEGGSEDL